MGAKFTFVNTTGEEMYIRASSTAEIRTLGSGGVFGSAVRTQINSLGAVFSLYGLSNTVWVVAHNNDLLTFLT